MSLFDGSVTGRVRNGPLPCSGAEFFVDGSAVAAAVDMSLMTTKIHLVVAADPSQNSEGFGSCHVGCTTWRPGTRRCKVWTHEELFRLCEAEVASMSADTRSLKIARMHAHRDAYIVKTPPVSNSSRRRKRAGGGTRKLDAGCRQSRRRGRLERHLGRPGSCEHQESAPPRQAPARTVRLRPHRSQRSEGSHGQARLQEPVFSTQR